MYASVPGNQSSRNSRAFMRTQPYTNTVNLSEIDLPFIGDIDLYILADTPGLV